MTKPVDLKDDPLVCALLVMIDKTIQMGLAYEDVSILDALAYVYATLQRYNDGTRPTKLN